MSSPQASKDAEETHVQSGEIKDETQPAADAGTAPEDETTGKRAPEKVGDVPQTEGDTEVQAEAPTPPKEEHHPRFLPRGKVNAPSGSGKK